MSDDFSHRRPYNAATRFRRRQCGARARRQDRVHRSGPLAHLRRAAGAHLPVRGRAHAPRACARKTASRLLLHDTVDYPVAFWGAIRAGIVVVPLNTLLTAAQYAYMLADSRVSTLVVAAPLARTLAADPRTRAAACGRSCSWARRPATRRCSRVSTSHRFEDLLAREQPALLTAPTISDEVAFWLYTSGSTGDPEGRQARPYQPDGDGAAHGPGRARHRRRRRGVFRRQAVLCLWPRQCHVVSDVGRRHRRAVARAGRCRTRASMSCAAIARRSSTACPRCSRPCWRTTTSAAAPAPTGCASASRPASRCPRRSASAGVRRSVSTSSTASARPKCCRPSSATGRATSATDRAASRLPATTRRSSTRTDRSSATTRSAN